MNMRWLSRKARNGGDAVAEATGEEMNAHGANYRLLVSVLCAALYPNIVQVNFYEFLQFFLPWRIRSNLKVKNTKSFKTSCSFAGFCVKNILKRFESPFKFGLCFVIHLPGSSKKILSFSSGPLSRAPLQGDRLRRSGPRALLAGTFEIEPELELETSLVFPTSP